MAKGVVHLLEAVQIDEHHRQVHLLSIRHHDELGETVLAKQGAVGKSGQRVVISLSPDGFLLDVSVR